MRRRIGLDEVDAVLRANGVSTWGVASNHPPMALAPSLSRAISLLVVFRAAALEGMHTGPTTDHFVDYQRLNSTLNAAASALADHLRRAGASARHLGMAHDPLYDEKACEAYLDRFPDLAGVCGVCVDVCPFGRRALSSLQP